jgi:hypothetical protein
MSPAFGFTVVGLIIVAARIIFERLRLPAVLGLLTFGALIGPKVLDLLPQSTGLGAVGNIGVLYLTFPRRVPARPRDPRPLPQDLSVPGSVTPTGVGYRRPTAPDRLEAAQCKG